VSHDHMAGLVACDDIHHLTDLFRITPLRAMR
jgi:hypothetical protein